MNTLAEEWEVFKKTSGLDLHGEESEHFFKGIFYAGAATVLNIAMTVSEDGAGGVDIVAKLWNETREEFGTKVKP